MAGVLKRINRFLSDSEYRYYALARRGFYNKLSDEKLIRRSWAARMDYKLDLNNPKTLCEKLQWLKLYYRKPILSTMVDKYAAKQFVADRVGTEYVIPTLGVWDDFDDIDFSILPDQFVLKPTHDSGGLVICRDKSTFDFGMAREKLQKSLKHNYYLDSREWAYKNVEPRIIAEPLIEELGKPESIEYKTTCFNGKVNFVTICTGIAHDDFDKRFNDHFDTDFNKMEWYVNYKPAHITPEKPEQWDELIDFCEKLAEGVPYLRVDSYIIDGKILFGEMTFYTWGGLMDFQPKEWDLKLGKMLNLPKEKL